MGFANVRAGTRLPDSLMFKSPINALPFPHFLALAHDLCASDRKTAVGRSRDASCAQRRAARTLDWTAASWGMRDDVTLERQAMKMAALSVMGHEKVRAAPARDLPMRGDFSDRKV